MKVCVACSAGGHFQELELVREKFINNNKTFYYSVKSKMYDNLQKERKMYLITDPKRNVFLNLWNFIYALYVFLKEKPKVILSNGASVAFPMCFYGWLFNRKVIYIDSITRINDISFFGKLIKPFTTEFYVFWPELIKKYKNMKLLPNILGTLKLDSNLQKIKSAKKIFVSVGSSKYNSERLIKFADNLAEKYKEKTFFCQIGDTKYLPKNCEYVKYLSYSDYQKKLRSSDYFISYAGVGSILSAIKYDKFVYLMPRLKEYGEAVDNHQKDFLNFLGGFI